MTELTALREVERLTRELLEGFEVKLHGECDGKIVQSIPCDNEIRVTEKCPKCGEPVEVNIECDNAIDVDEYCENEVELEPDDDAQARFRALSLALVQLDLARAAESERLNDPMFGVSQR